MKKKYTACSLVALPKTITLLEEDVKRFAKQVYPLAGFELRRHIIIDIRTRKKSYSGKNEFIIHFSSQDEIETFCSALKSHFGRLM
jgi:hypothetical protein